VKQGQDKNMTTRKPIPAVLVAAALLARLALPAANAPMPRPEGKAEVCMDVGEAMGKAVVELMNNEN